MSFSWSFRFWCLGLRVSVPWGPRSSKSESVNSNAYLHPFAPTGSEVILQVVFIKEAGGAENRAISVAKIVLPTLMKVKINNHCLFRGVKMRERDVRVC